MKGGSKESLSLGLERAQYFEHFQDMGRVSLGGKDLGFFSSKGVQAHGISLPDIEVRERADELFGVLELACGGPETHGAAAV
jgi:hypothetical protein